MRYGSVCSGIEAASVAWESLGWKASFLSEIETFPRRVLAHHYPNTKLHGDFTTIKKDDYDPIELLVGGTPCQSFSVAGLRAGLDDPRGNLMLEFGSLARRLNPKWLVWENVPGVLSSNRGRDFGTFLGMLGELGYGFAYRVLDAQYFGVAQRRRRVFVVGCFGDWRSAAAVLFDTESLRGNTPPSREAGEVAAANIEKGVGTCSGKPVFGTLLANCGTKQWLGNQEALSGDYHVFALAGNTIGRQPENGGNGNGYDESGVSYTLTKTDQHAICYPINTQIATRHEAMGKGTGMGIGFESDPAYTLQAAHSHAVAFAFDSLSSNSMKSRNPISGCNEVDVSKTIDTSGLNPSCNQGGNAVLQTMQVRRLTPTECERLQGFPDGYTNIPGASDTGRYKALGNSMAVPVMKWIGERIQAVENTNTK
jgi:DNA (cytosine-5)-methyltransferase 1